LCYLNKFSAKNNHLNKTNIKTMKKKSSKDFRKENL
jgi:hypothetical protein